MEPRELVRVLIPDTDAVFGENGDEYMMSDEQIDAFLTVAGGSVLRAAGLACVAVASSEAIISKIIKTQDLSTNGAQIADALRENGKVLLARADKEEQDSDFAFFQVIDYPVGHYRPELTERPWTGW